MNSRRLEVNRATTVEQGKRGVAPIRRVTRDVTYCTHSRFNEPTLIVSPGETFMAETELCTGDWLKSIDDCWEPGIGFGPNPTVVVEIDGAQPGDMLAVHIDDIQPDELGYTGFAPGQNPFPDWIRHVEWGVVTKTVRIRDGLIEWSNDLKLPIKPMIGTLGTAPAVEVFSNAWPGRYGGNMDVQEVCPGATVYLPVNVPGALLHIGDVHAIQGDGEINCGGGIECRSEVTLTVNLEPKPERMSWPRIVNDTHLIAVGCARPAEDAFRIATEQLIYWLADDYNTDERDAFLLLGQVLEARCTQFVDPLYTYVAKINRKYLR
jgi:amidase